MVALLDEGAAAFAASSNFLATSLSRFALSVFSRVPFAMSSSIAAARSLIRGAAIAFATEADREHKQRTHRIEIIMNHRKKQAADQNGRKQA